MTTKTEIYGAPLFWIKQARWKWVCNLSQGTDIRHSRNIGPTLTAVYPRLCWFPDWGGKEATIFKEDALASLVNIYVAALNTPGMVSSVQSAWETFVHAKCTEAKYAAVQVYDKAMLTQLDKCQLPCDSDDIRKMQKNAVEKSMVVFQAETVGFSATSSEIYLKELMEYTENKLKALQERNSDLTRKECRALLKRLQKERLDPILALLATEGGSKVSFADIVSGYSAIEDGFKSQSRGAKDLCAQVFYEFHPELQKDMQKHLAQLQQLKEYEERLAQERDTRARHEQERKRLEEEKKRLEDEHKTVFSKLEDSKH
ncbi:guanylate-binding protein 4-like [Acropora muricata]|uniref:guanylate-binding protein 4-like n=1 Tax=Acropora muricata TaxID=159855 RepID=UPI0034E5B56F